MSPHKWDAQPVRPEDLEAAERGGRPPMMPGSPAHLLVLVVFACVLAGFLWWNEELVDLGEFCTAIQGPAAKVGKANGSYSTLYVDQGRDAPPEYEIFGATSKDLQPGDFAIVRWRQTKFLKNNQFEFVKKVEQCEAQETSN